MKESEKGEEEKKKKNMVSTINDLHSSDFIVRVNDSRPYLIFHHHYQSTGTGTCWIHHFPVQFMAVMTENEIILSNYKCSLRRQHVCYPKCLWLIFFCW